MPSHIVFVEGYYPRASGIIGGAGSYIKNFGKELTYLGYEVSVICVKMNDNRITYFKDGLINVYPIMDSKPDQLIYLLNKVPLIKIISGLLFYLHNGLKIHLFLRKLNRLKKIDYIEYSEGGDFWNSLNKKFNYSSHLHGSSYTFKSQSNQRTDLIDWIRRKMEHFFILRANKVISPCHAMIELVEKEIGKELTKAHVIPYPIDNSALTINNKLKKSKKVVLLFASRNDPVKGGEVLINALGLLSDSIKSKIQVEFYGYVPERDLSHIPFLQVNEFVPNKDLVKAYQKADICIIPSLFDNSPNTVYEAMAQGKIIVASAVGGIPEIIGNKENGYLFNSRDVNDLVLKLAHAIKMVSEGACQTMRSNAQQRIKTISNLSNNVEQRLNLIGL